MDVVAYVMPDATEEEIDFEFDLHDINDNGIVSIHEAHKV